MRDRIHPVPHPTSAVAVDFDAVLGDTGPLWRAWVADACRRYRVQLEDDPDEPYAASRRQSVLLPGEPAPWDPDTT